MTQCGLSLLKQDREDDAGADDIDDVRPGVRILRIRDAYNSRCDANIDRHYKDSMITKGKYNC